CKSAQSVADLPPMNFTYYGHACFSVEAGGKTLLFDPFITPNPLAKKIDAGKIAADFILVSHGHGDPLADVVEIAQRTGPPGISSPWESRTLPASRISSASQTLSASTRIPFLRSRSITTPHRKKRAVPGKNCPCRGSTKQSKCKSTQTSGLWGRTYVLFETRS